MAVNKHIKKSLFLFILLFWIGGCVILGVSIYFKVSKNGNVIMDEAVPFVDLLIAVGVIIMVLGFLGCCGAIKENRCMLILFFIGLLHIFILLFIAGILGAVGEKNEERLTPDPSVDHTESCKIAKGRKGYSKPCAKFMTFFIASPFSMAVLTLFGMAFTMTLYCQIEKRDANTA
ncbi:tetraspanin-8-like [Oncorhynchus clarkii lewisi]|uniref:tetraspanin-8-like n=1 Tax=Oncorhynchus clarkii lewisi TaxID=490388 RepID=UPI0039B97DE4